MAIKLPPRHGDAFLSGWKMIEDWLGLTRNTIIARGYPVSRGRRGNPVMASKEQLFKHTAWLIANPATRVRRELARRRRLSLARALRKLAGRRQPSLPSLKRRGLVGTQGQAG